MPDYLAARTKSLKRPKLDSAPAFHRKRSCSRMDISTTRAPPCLWRNIGTSRSDSGRHRARRRLSRRPTAALSDFTFLVPGTKRWRGNTSMRVRSRDRRPTSALNNEDAVGRAVATVKVRVVRVIDIRHVNVGRLITHLNDDTVVHRHRISRDDLHAVAAQGHVG